MPYVWKQIWQNDPIDDQAERLNRLTYAEACRRSGWYHRKLQGLVESGVLRTVLYGGRKFIDGDSLARLINSQGQGPTLQEQADELRRCGRHQEAMWLLENAQRRAVAEERKMLGGQSFAELAREYADPLEQPDRTADLPSVTESILARLRRGQ